jgi:hypothetical protein
VSAPLLVSRICRILIFYNFDRIEPKMSLNFGLNVKAKKLKPKLILDDGADEAVKPMARPVEITMPTQGQEEDLNEYDVHFDANQQNKLRLKRERDGDFGDGKKARYMQVLIENSKQRRLERQAIKDKRMQQENEDLYGHVETFVTESYKQKMKEEEELKLKQEQEDKAKNVGGFYKGLLDQVEKQRGPIILGDQNMAKKYLKDADNITQIETERINVDFGKKNVKLNDDGQVVDNIKQLKGGINFIRPTVVSTSANDAKTVRKEPTRRIPVQKEANLKRKADVMQQKQTVEAIQLDKKAQIELKFVESIKSKIDAEKQAEARERYLARKKAPLP